MKTKLGFIGAGNMARALARGLAGSGTLAASEMRAFDPSATALAALGAETGVTALASNVAVASWADTLLLAVKPQVVDAALSELRGAADGKLVISIAAGVPTERLQAALGASARVIRAMPNTPAIVGAGATGVSAAATASAADLELAEELFNAVGRSVIVPESALDAVTGLSGSGPAYAMLIVEALADGGVSAGLSREVAHTLAVQTLLGSARLLLETGEHPGKLKDMVTSPAGTTIAGLQALEAGGVRHALMQAVANATARSRELGRRG